MNKISPSITKIASVTGLLLGAFALSVLAADVWTQAGCAAPGCNTAAPVNVGTARQYKEGGLSIGKTTEPTSGYNLDVIGNGMFDGLSVTGLTVTNTLKMVNGAQNGYIMTSDASGNAIWTAASSVATGNNIDISGWAQSWYGADQTHSGGAQHGGNMIKRTGPGSSSDDEGVCPPKAVMIGIDRDGSNLLTLLCAAPTTADLPSSFVPINW